nr:Uncharacterised protein [Streptococcus thermophilus]
MDTQRSLVGPNGLRKTIIALVTIIAVALAAAFGGITVPTAHAKVQKVNVTNMTATGDAYNEANELIPGKKLQVDLDFEAATQGGFDPGDTFSINMPESFNVGGSNFDLLSGGTKVGTCSPAGSVVTCTITGDNLVGKYDIKGKMSFAAVVKEDVSDVSNKATVKVGEAGAETQVTFTYRNSGGDVVNPPGVAPKKPRRTIASVVKNQTKNEVRVENGKKVVEITWEIWVPGGKIQNLEKFELTDVLSEETEGTQGEFTYGYAEQSFWAYQVAEQLDDTSSYVRNEVPFKLDKNANNKSATITVTRPEGGWKTEADGETVQPVSIGYRTQYVGDEFPAEKSTFGNKVTVLGETAEDSFEYVQVNNASIEGVDRAGFELTKNVVKQGDWSGDCPTLDDQEYEVKIKIDLPQSSIGKFEFTETKAEKGGDATETETGITYTEKLKDGQTVKAYDELPQGSKVSFTEATATGEGVKFGKPKFASNGTALDSNEITIEDVTKNVPVTLTNPVECTPKTGELHIFKEVVSAEGKGKLSDEELAAARKQLADDKANFSVTVDLQFPEDITQEQLDRIKINGAEANLKRGEIEPITLDIADNGEVKFSDLPEGTKATIRENEERPAVKGIKFGKENLLNYQVDAEQETRDKIGESSEEIKLNIKGQDCYEIEIKNPVEKDRSGLWWLLLLIPVIPGLIWLTGKIPGMSSNPTPPNTPVPGDNPKPGQPGDNPKPGQPGDKPDAQQPGTPEQPGQPGAPGEGRQPIQSVPSGATEKGDDVADFIG